MITQSSSSIQTILSTNSPVSSLPPVNVTKLCAVSNYANNSATNCSSLIPAFKNSLLSYLMSNRRSHGSQQLPLCPEAPPGLIGLVPVDKYPVGMKEIEKRHL